MSASIKLGKIIGIPIGLNTSWFLIFFLVTWSLAIGYFPEEYPQLSRISQLILAVATSILFFGSVLLHELGHAVIALRNKIPVKGITLFIFGGVAQIGREPALPGVEFRIAIAGPITSLLLSLFFGLLYQLDQQISYLAAPSLYLMRINLILALFNMIPGFPLDGGRVLRSIVWKFSGDFERATRIASGSGQIIAFGFIGLGIFTIFSGELMNGLWLTFIGWFLQNAASAAGQQISLQKKLRGTSVSQVMSKDCTPVPGLVSLNQLIQERVLNKGEHCFMIEDLQGSAVGLLTLQDITHVPQVKWRFTRAADVMTPLHKFAIVSPEMDLLDAMKKMDQEGLPQMMVMDQFGFVGMISRENVLQYLKLRSELGI